jgi:hypothetical protein
MSVMLWIVQHGYCMVGRSRLNLIVLSVLKGRSGNKTLGINELSINIDFTTI